MGNRYRLTEERFKELTDRSFNIPELIKAFGVENINKGYWVCTAHNSDVVIDGAQIIERIDMLGLFDDDFDACRQAEKDGVKFINDIDGLEKGCYIDTPENREHCLIMLEKYPNYRVENWIIYNDGMYGTKYAEHFGINKASELEADQISLKGITFSAGYHEWNVFKGDECIYTFDGGISEEFGEGTTYEELITYIDMCIEAMYEHWKAEEKELLDEIYIPELKRQMAEEWSSYFDISMENKISTPSVHIYHYITADERAKNPELKSDLLYWSNGAGDLHYHGRFDIDEDQLPSELKYAYNELWREDYGTYCYLVENKNGYGIALTAEFDEFYAEDCDIDMETLFAHMKAAVYEIAKHPEFSKSEFYVSEFTGFEECHDFCVVFPAMTSKEEFQKAAKLFDELVYQTVEENIEKKNNLIPFKVTVTETLTRDIVIYANSKNSAVEIAKELCNESEIDLTMDDFNGREVIATAVAKEHELGQYEIYGKKKMSLADKINKVKEKKNNVIDVLHKYREEDYER